MEFIKICTQVLPQKVLDASSWVQTTWTATQEKAHRLRLKVHQVFLSVLISMITWLEGNKLKTPRKDLLEALQKKVEEESQKSTDSYSNLQLEIAGIIAAEAISQTQGNAQ
jgi:hypothetical protein